RDAQLLPQLLADLVHQRLQLIEVARHGVPLPSVGADLVAPPKQEQLVSVLDETGEHCSAWRLSVVDSSIGQVRQGRGQLVYGSGDVVESIRHDQPLAIRRSRGSSPGMVWASAEPSKGAATVQSIPPRGFAASSA